MPIEMQTQSRLPRDTQLETTIDFRITHSIFPIFWSHSCFPGFVDPHNCVDPHGRVVSYLLTLFLRTSSQNRSFSRIPFGCRERCGGVLMMGSLPSSSAVPPHRNQEPLPRTINIPEVVERCTAKRIHQLRWLAATSAPSDWK
jgi:hypothetical protein